MSESSAASSDSSSCRRSPRERKDCLKRALEQTLVLQTSINKSTINKLNEAITEADIIATQTDIQEKVFNQQEVVMDSLIMISSSKVLKTCTVSLTKKMNDYDYTDFAQKLVKHIQGMSDNPELPPDWSFLEPKVTTMFKRVPNCSTILGTLEPLEKKVIVRKKPEQRVAQQAAMIVPEKLVRDVNTNDEDSVERTVRKIRKLIISYYKEKHEPLDFFKLILPPDDFGRTVRNMLYISFLVKDGVVTVRKDENGNLVVQPCRKPKNLPRTDTRTGVQNIISINMKYWTILKETYKEEEPMIDFDENK
ncbi:non-structural maintenance of chromosomes element 4 homolog A [Nylanderia fulva]|uniref:non-structural maintenance of chromosomes element 4 homolog A n=1 Tax=Nylanderia fulva TaxID=613905 RepID=UPI0010FB4F3F|nr:non-structural maintenance of chromosomes element 4 homolog A [Nylanderia fulva]